MLPHRVIVAIFLTLLSQGNLTSAIPIGSPKFDTRGEHIQGEDASNAIESRGDIEIAKISERDLIGFLEPRVNNQPSTLQTSTTSQELDWYSLIYDACTQGAAAASSAASAAQKGVDMQTATNAAASTPGELYVKYIGTAVVSAGLVYGGYRVFFKFFGSAIKKDLGKKTPKEIKEMKPLDFEGRLTAWMQESEKETNEDNEKEKTKARAQNPKLLTFEPLPENGQPDYKKGLVLARVYKHDNKADRKTCAKLMVQETNKWYDEHPEYKDEDSKAKKGAKLVGGATAEFLGHDQDQTAADIISPAAGPEGEQ